MEKSDMTQGSVWQLVMKTALPMVIAQVVNMLYNIVDRIFIGKIEGVGTVALGGVGIYLPIGIIVMAFALWIGSGGAPKAAIEMGRKDKSAAEKILGNCVLPIVFIGIVITGVLLLFDRQILPLFGATETNLPYALEYTNMIAIGTVFNMLAVGLNTFINTQGKTLMGMMSILIGAVVNLVLDAVFVLGMGMGVKGAAIATVIGQCISCIWVVGFLLSKKSMLRIRRENLIPQPNLLGGIVALGIAAFITTSVESLVTIVLNFVLKKYGAAALTGYPIDGATLAISVSAIITMASSFILMPINGFTQGIQPIISYNYGAGRNDRVKKAALVSCTVCTIYAATICAVLVIAPQLFAGMFTSDIDVINIAMPFLRIYVSAMTLLGIQTTIQQYFAALGMARYSIGIAISRKFLYVPLLLLLPALVSTTNSITAIYIAEPLSDLFAFMVTIILFIMKRKFLAQNHALDAGLNRTQISSALE